MPRAMTDEIKNSESQRRGCRADEEGTAGKNPCGVASIPPQRSRPAGGLGTSRQKFSRCHPESAWADEGSAVSCLRTFRHWQAAADESRGNRML